MNGGAQILREMGGDWLECQDGQGIFYHNAATKQSSDTLPQELMGAVNGGSPMGGQVAMGGQEGSTVLRELPNNWLECRDDQGIFFWNRVTQQSSDSMPVELVGVMQAPAAAPMAVPMQAAPMAQPQFIQTAAPSITTTPAAMAVAAPGNAGQTAILRQLPNNWLECKDELGIYFFNQITQESSETMPAELLTASFQPALAAPVMSGRTTTAAPMAAPLSAYSQGHSPVQATVLGGGIQNSYAPATSQSYQPASYGAPSKPQSYQPSVSYTPMQIPQQQSVQQVTAAPGSYVPVQMAQQPYVQQLTQSQLQPQGLYQQQPQVVYQQEQQLRQQSQPQVMQQQAAPQPVMQAPPGARKKSVWGDWIAFEDGQGTEFFVQASTGQRFDYPPPAAVQSYQAYKAAGLIVPA